MCKTLVTKVNRGECGLGVNFAHRNRPISGIYSLDKPEETKICRLLSMWELKIRLLFVELSVILQRKVKPNMRRLES